MDGFLGIGGAEVLLVFVLALVVLGPRGMLRTARRAGRLLRDLRRYFDVLMLGIEEELERAEHPPEPSTESTDDPPLTRT